MNSVNKNEIHKTIGIKFNQIIISRPKFEIYKSQTVFSITKMTSVFDDQICYIYTENHNGVMTLNDNLLLVKIEIPEFLACRNIFIWCTIAVTLLQFTIPAMTRASGASINISIYFVLSQDLDMILSTTPMLMETDVQDFVAVWHIISWFTIAVTLLILYLPIVTHTSGYSSNRSIYHRSILEYRKDYFTLSTLYFRRFSILYCIIFFKREESRKRRKETLKDLFI